jgi:hypothetical protein
MSSGNGWIGSADELLYFLSVVGADKTPDGNYIITGEPVISGLGGLEIVVPAGACYLKDGKRVNLAAALQQTSYGVHVKVY